MAGRTAEKNDSWQPGAPSWWLIEQKRLADQQAEAEAEAERAHQARRERNREHTMRTWAMVLRILKYIGIGLLVALAVLGISAGAVASSSGSRHRRR
jgi:hypothetical protein